MFSAAGGIRWDKMFSTAGGVRWDPLFSTAGGIHWDPLYSAAGGICWDPLFSVVSRNRYKVNLKFMTFEVQEVENSIEIEPFRHKK